jgi:predicted nucleotidyltransferase
MDFATLKKAIQKEGILSLSRKTGLSRSTIHDFTHFNKGISLKNLELLAHALGFQINLLPLNCQEILGSLLLHREKLKEAGVEHLSLFGSVARGTHRPDSDIDLLVTARKMEGLRTISGIQKCLDGIFPASRIDLIFASSLRPQMKKAIEEDLIDVF